MDSDQGDGSNILTFPTGAGAKGGVERGIASSDPAQQVARQLYLGFRPKCDTSREALSRVLVALAQHRSVLPVEAPPADADLLEAWSVEDDWEGRYRASLGMEILDAPAGDAQRYLVDLQYQCERARDFLFAITGELEGPPPVDWDLSKSWPSNELVRRWTGAQERWIALAREVRAAREGVERLSKEGTRTDYWEAEYQRTLADLNAEYGELGPQYRILLRRTAALDVRLRQMESSGRDLDPSEYKMMHETHLKYVTSLQRYRESLKSESVQPVKEAVLKVMGILERRVKPRSAELWSDVVEDVVAALGELEAAG